VVVDDEAPVVVSSVELSVEVAFESSDAVVLAVVVATRADVDVAATPTALLECPVALAANPPIRAVNPAAAVAATAVSRLTRRRFRSRLSIGSLLLIPEHLSSRI
jgi:hypothetical protein